MTLDVRVSLTTNIRYITISEQFYTTFLFVMFVCLCMCMSLSAVCVYVHLYSNVTCRVLFVCPPQNVSVIHEGLYRAPVIQRGRYVTRSQGSVSAGRTSEGTHAASAT